MKLECTDIIVVEFTTSSAHYDVKISNNTDSFILCPDFIVQQLEADLALHNEKVKSLSEQSRKLVEGKHFDAANIAKKTTELENRFSFLIMHR